MELHRPGRATGLAIVQLLLCVHGTYDFAIKLIIISNSFLLLNAFDQICIHIVMHKLWSYCQMRLRCNTNLFRQLRCNLLIVCCCRHICFDFLQHTSKEMHTTSNVQVCTVQHITEHFEILCFSCVWIGNGQPLIWMNANNEIRLYDSVLEQKMYPLVQYTC